MTDRLSRESSHSLELFPWENSPGLEEMDAARSKHPPMAEALGDPRPNPFVLDTPVRNPPPAWGIWNFYSDHEGPWFPKSVIPQDERGRSKAAASGYRGAPTQAYHGYRSALPSECETIPPALPSDSGYESRTKQSIENTSMFGDFDRNHDTQSLTGHLMNYQPFYPDSVPSVDTLQRDGWMSSLAVTQPRGASNDGTNNSSLVCPVCKQPVKTKSELTKHHQRHSKPFVCDVPRCNRKKGFGTKNDLERHKNSVHGDMQVKGVRYRCTLDQCQAKNKTWPRADNFRSHLKRIHQRDLSAEDDLSEFIIPPGSTEDYVQDDLEGVGLAPEYTFPLDGNPPLSTLPGYLMEQRNDNPREQITNPPFNHQQALQTVRNGRLVSEPPPLIMDEESEAYLADTSTMPDGHSTVSRGSGVESTQSQHAADSLVQTRIDVHHSVGFVQPTQVMNAMPEAQSQDDSDMDPQSDMEYEEATTHETIPASLDVNTLQSTAGAAERHDIVPAAAGTQRRPVIATETSEAIKKAKLETTSPRSDSDSPVPVFTPASTPSAAIDPPDEVHVFQVLQKFPKELLEKYLKNFAEPAENEAEPVAPAAAGTTTSDSSQNTCPDCSKQFNRMCELRKHKKRHEKPYGCTFSGCYKRFGSKNDWKRHENSQHFQLEIWKCLEKKASADTETCGKVCHRRESFKNHLQRDHAIEDDCMDKALDKGRIGRQSESKFWCGFCEDIVEIKERGANAWTERFNHIDYHLFGKNGLTKKVIEEWVYVEPEAPVKERPSEDSSTSDAEDGIEAAAKANNVNDHLESKKSRDRKRRKTGATDTSEPKRLCQDVTHLWYCCKCSMQNNHKTTAECVLTSGCNHRRCDDCRQETISLVESRSEKHSKREGIVKA